VCIVSRINGMLSAVDFNNETLRETNEVDDVSADWRLSAELPSSDLASPQYRPEPPLGVSLLLAKCPGPA
jgi:hypothetical protein